MGELGIVQDAAVLCVGGKIVVAGAMREVVGYPWVKKNRRKLDELDCSGQVVLPGFVDSHTHPACMQPRLVDFEKRIAGIQDVLATRLGRRRILVWVLEASHC